MCIIVLDLFIGLEVGEIKTVIDEAETYNAAVNLMFTLKVCLKKNIVILRTTVTA